MSEKGTKPNFWQSTSNSTIRERCKYILNQELLSDVKFFVRDHRSEGGSANKPISGHKFVLAISSPVFYAMFYGDMAERGNTVEISDCDYESLMELFRFIYCDEANLTPDNVMQLMYLAKKYMLPSLADKCSTFLQENLDGSNVFNVLPHAQKYEEKGLLDRCWKVIDEETEEAVKSDGFVTIDGSTLEKLVERDTLRINEVELFRAIDRWAVKECQKKGLAAKGSEKRRILGERIVKGIRFPLMSQKEFASIVLDCKILTTKESFEMVKYFSDAPLTTPLGFMRAQRAGQHSIVSRFGSIGRGNWGYSGRGPDVIGISVDKPIKLHAVRFFGSESNTYSVTLIVQRSGDISTSKTMGNFSSELIRSELGDYYGFNVFFQCPILLVKNASYYLTAAISGTNSSYGDLGQSTVQKCGVIFNFLKRTGSTDIRRGQFSEFLFTPVS
ncbi:BTB/POZ domain-containing protein 6-B-like [Montipora capricornis]|uniref:BTB/POZ domain-containing protein 6-B-like n=1 Tax=Montipora capricornis TaxID=246305 RepID=UPI0035F1A566